ncbi:aspartate kinase [Vannielia litorea]|uniref:aspartate kinase n=1 Tax=Vannielia litorea TaxID=1217970 RepID=A0A1N6FWV9_9RHOB|nr:aspartate kinase [Vannielia litorea]SIN99846.1 aspartate kinase [Vannielia litorea]
MTHTVEKIGGTSMDRIHELRDTLILGGRGTEGLYGRVFVVSAFGGITNLLLEHKKTGEPGVYAAYARDDDALGEGWEARLSAVAEAMRGANARVLDHGEDRATADAFVDDRIQGARTSLLNLRRLCRHGHFRLSENLAHTRELLAGLGEAHSAHVTTLLLQRAGVKARFIDLSGWRDEGGLDLAERITTGLKGVDVAREMPIVTGYAQCREGLMSEFDRGYSEVTFSQLAALTGAREAIIHKEFHLSSADPNLVGPGAARKLGRTNYDVADQLSNLGMEAIHPKAAKTLRQAEVPLRVTNAFEPEDPGTLIDDHPAESPAVEIVTGLKLYAFELFEQDMVGVKGYDAAILEALTRHRVRIVSKVSNANTITHYVDTSPKVLRRVEKDLAARYPSAEISARAVAIASAIGRDLAGLSVLTRGLQAIAGAGLEAIGATQGPRNVDVQFVLERDDLDPAISALHHALVEAGSERLARAA